MSEKLTIGGSGISDKANMAKLLLGNGLSSSELLRLTCSEAALSGGASENVKRKVYGIFTSAIL